MKNVTYGSGRVYYVRGNEERVDWKYPKKMDFVSALFGLLYNVEEQRKSLLYPTNQRFAREVDRISLLVYYNYIEQWSEVYIAEPLLVNDMCLARDKYLADRDKEKKLNREQLQVAAVLSVIRLSETERIMQMMRDGKNSLSYEELQAVIGLMYTDGITLDQALELAA